MTVRIPIAVALSLLVVAAPARAACSIGKVAELPVSGEHAPIVEGGINGSSVRFIVDSSMFFSQLRADLAPALHLAPHSAPYGVLRLDRERNTATTVSFATIKTLTLGKATFSRIDVALGSPKGKGIDGVLGQNVLGLGDVEYDLHHGAIRLLQQTGCDATASLAYWSANGTDSVISIEPRSAQNTAMVGPVWVNDVALRAVFDSAARFSALSLKAAARLGITPTSPGVIPGGTALRSGKTPVPTWIAPIRLLVIGGKDGERVANLKIHLVDLRGSTDMLLGTDFFRAHRIYVDNTRNRLFVTYEGGPIFDLKVLQEEADVPASAEE